MSIYLGNLTVDQFQERTGYPLKDRDIEWLKSHLQANADIKYGSEKIHIFDLPFAIHCDETIIKELMAILRSYEDRKPALERLMIVPIDETEQEKNNRIQREQAQRDDEERKANPNAIWNVKWHMSVLVQLDNNRSCYYDCFINTYIKGYENIPTIVDGNAWIRKDLQGLHGQFNLKEVANNANEHPDWNYVVGIGFRDLNGIWIGEIKEKPFFQQTTFNIAEAIKCHEKLVGRKSTEIHFYK